MGSDAVIIPVDHDRFAVPKIGGTEPGFCDQEVAMSR
jgi:hypothetical protein